MIYDFNREVPRGILTPKICIVGAGAVGLTIAKEFELDTNIDVLILEAGGEHPQAMDRLETPLNSGDVASSVSGSFNQGFGGSTLNWGGQVLPFSKLDFTYRPWVDKSHWMLDKTTLETFYSRASTTLNVDYCQFSNNAQLVNHKNSADAALDYGFSKWCPEPKLNLVLGGIIKQSKSINLLVNACVDQIHTKNSRVSEISIVNLKGDREIILPRYTIIAAGGVESVRIMLRSAVESGCFGPAKLPALGRFYQDHIGFYGAKLTPLNMSLFRAMFSTKIVNGQKIQPKIFLSKNIQRSEKLLNVVANIGIEENRISTMMIIKEIYREKKSINRFRLTCRYSGKILCDLPSLVSALYSFFIRKQIHIPTDASFFLIANCESPPLASSKITLSHEKDQYGFQKAIIHWVLDDQSRVSMMRYYVAAKKEIEALGVATLEIKPYLFTETAEWKKHCYSLFHHMGATRMGESPKDSVVDENCKVHSLDNLFVAGASVLPTTSASNPTFTALALSIKLADHLKKKLV